MIFLNTVLISTLVVIICATISGVLAVVQMIEDEDNEPSDSKDD